MKRMILTFWAVCGVRSGVAALCLGAFFFLVGSTHLLKDLLLCVSAGLFVALMFFPLTFVLCIILYLLLRVVSPKLNAAPPMASCMAYIGIEMAIHTVLPHLILFVLMHEGIWGGDGLVHVAGHVLSFLIADIPTGILLYIIWKAPKPVETLTPAV